MNRYTLIIAFVIVAAVAGYVFKQQAVDPAAAAGPMATQPAPLQPGQAYIAVEAQDGQWILQTPAPSMIETANPQQQAALDAMQVTTPIPGIQPGDPLGAGHVMTTAEILTAFP